MTLSRADANGIFDRPLTHVIMMIMTTVFENHSKSRIQHCERSELRLHFEWTKVHQKCKKMVHEATFQTVLLDRSI